MENSVSGQIARGRVEHRVALVVAGSPAVVASTEHCCPVLHPETDSPTGTSKGCSVVHSSSSGSGRLLDAMSSMETLSPTSVEDERDKDSERDALLLRRPVMGAAVRHLRASSPSSFDEGTATGIELATMPVVDTASEFGLSSDDWDLPLSPASTTFSWSRLWMFMGPGFLISIAYIDPGNFDTDIVAGANFKYSLIWVLAAATMLGLLLQNLSARLGVVTGLNLAELCALEYPRPIRLVLWAITELTIIASDIPEVVGTAFALKFLFGLPLPLGVIVTAFSVLLFLAVNYFGARKLEILIGGMILVVVICFVSELFLSDVSIKGVISGFVPSLNWSAAYAATSLVGAVVMPHNLFLHSALVQTRPIRRTFPALREACFYNLVESAIALAVSFFINVAVIAMSAAEFGPEDHVGLLSAPVLMKKVLKGSTGPTLFAIALLASGQSSTMTGTYAGQFVMEGFLDLKMAKWKRALVTRSVAIMPSLAVSLIAGEQGSDDLIILSQVILSVLLPFALIPLVKATNSPKVMGDFANGRMVKFGATLLGSFVTLANMSLVYMEMEPRLLSLAGVESIFARTTSVLVFASYAGALSYMLYRPIMKTSAIDTVR